jgi:hypothetical protein
MVVYICYDRYEHNEWFNVFEVSTDRDESYRKCKETHLPDFICYGPDDCHSFQLQMVEMTKRDYNQLMKWFNDPTQSLENHGKDSSDYFKFMCELYDLTGEYNCCLISTDGCSDIYEIIKFYGKMKGLNPDDLDDDQENGLQEELFDMDDDKCLEIIKKYVEENY